MQKKMLDSHRALSTSKHHCYFKVAKLTTYLLALSALVKLSTPSRFSFIKNSSAKL